MSRYRGLKFVEHIKPTFKNAKAIKSLTYQDALAAGFENPYAIADPLSFREALEQWMKLLRHPERYSGYTLNGELVAFIKHNALHVEGAPDQWIILGLVASDDLHDDELERVLKRLLMLPVENPRTGMNRTVNVAIHDNDPLLEIALRYGFIPVGKPDYQEGAPGLKQQNYQLS